MARAPVEWLNCSCQYNIKSVLVSVSQIHKTTDRAVRFWCESDGERETRRGTTVGEKIERKQLLIKNGVLNVHSSHGVSHIWHPDMYEQLRCGAPPSPVTGYDVLDVPPTGPLWMFYSPVSSVMDLKYSLNKSLAGDWAPRPHHTVLFTKCYTEQRYLFFF